MRFADVIGSDAGRFFLIASSDMNHYESDAAYRWKTQSSIAYWPSNRASFSTPFAREKFSMVDTGARIANVHTPSPLGATLAELVRYATSGDINGDLQKSSAMPASLFSGGLQVDPHPVPALSTLT